MLAGRGLFETVEHSVAGAHPVPVLPLRVGSIGRWLRSPAPTMGQDNDRILASLGVSEEERAQLAAEQVIGTRPVGL